MQTKLSSNLTLATRWARPFSKQQVAHALLVMAPTFIALTFATIAHAQGTIDFSGAQTVMSSFKTFALYAGAIICFGGLINVSVALWPYFRSFRFMVVSTIWLWTQPV